MGTILAFGFNFNPSGTAFCNGAILGIPQNSALFALLGTTYGGNGQTTFGIPDLQGRVIVGQGSGAGLTPRVMGEKSGSERVSLTPSQLPSHTHTAAFVGTSVTIKASGNAGTQAIAAGRINTIGGTTGGFLYNNDASPAVVLNVAGTAAGTVSVNAIGDNQQHDNMQPYTVLNYCIVLEGIFPSRD